VFLVDEFPMTSSGKIQKVKLREEALRRLAAPSGPR
jgi:acyl-coenzyme A synthetase/AMP-(fatty) acid ligase